MMQAIKMMGRECNNRWYIIAQVVGQGNTAWALDRWRLYYPKATTKVGIYYDLNSYSSENGKQYKMETPDLVAPFHAGGGWTTDTFEHDFTFDLSADTANCYLAIKCIPDTAEFQQIYAGPSGYGASRGKNANLFSWDFSIVNTGTFVGGADTSLIFKDQSSFQLLEWKDVTTTPTLYAKNLFFQNCNIDQANLDKLIIWTERGGISTGTLNYSGNSGIPSNASKAAYDALIARGWTITGTAPLPA
jgi:hypothetical protein